MNRNRQNCQHHWCRRRWRTDSSNIDQAKLSDGTPDVGHFWKIKAVKKWAFSTFLEEVHAMRYDIKLWPKLQNCRRRRNVNKIMTDLPILDRTPKLTHSKQIWNLGVSTLSIVYENWSQWRKMNVMPSICDFNKSVNSSSKANNQSWPGESDLSHLRRPIFNSQASTVW